MFLGGVWGRCPEKRLPCGACAAGARNNSKTTMSDQDSKTENPTQKRLTQAQEEGNFPRVPELSTLCVMLGMLVLLSFTLKDAFRDLGRALSGLFSQLHALKLNEETAVDGFSSLMYLCLRFLLPIFLCCMIGGILAGALQSGFRFSPKALNIKWDRVNPTAGFKRLFGMQNLIQFGLDCLKLLTIGSVIYICMRRILGHAIFHTPVTVGTLGDFMLETSALMWTYFIGALGIIATLHYLYERIRVQKQLMMSKSELKDELKDQETDPQLKQSRRRMALNLLQKRMLKTIPNADVVITNPTHYAIALKYEHGKDKAPILLAKGKNLFARRIRELAQSLEVPIVENPPVARMLYKVGRIGRSIPVELYQVVAEILAHVYSAHRYYFHQLKRRRMQTQSNQQADWVKPLSSEFDQDS